VWFWTCSAGLSLLVRAWHYALAFRLFRFAIGTAVPTFWVKREKVVGVSFFMYNSACCDHHAYEMSETLIALVIGHG